MTKTEIQEYLKKISQENILNAFQQMDESEKSTQSLIRQYVVKHEGKTYPPPETLRIAYKNATSAELPEGFFTNIGEGSEQFKFIRELGFEIVKKEVLNQRNNMENRIVVFKKVPKNEVLDGTELSILKFYMDEGLIQDPKTSNKRFETSNKARYYPIKFLYKKIQYNYQIKAYPTSNWRKDRRFIINTSDPIFKDRAEGDFLCYCFDNKIDGESNVIAELIKKDSLDYQLISSKYNAKKGYVLRDPTDKDLIDTIFDKSIEKKINMPLNQILFGPPGTGKTYSTITKALNIIGLLKEKDNYTNEEYEKAQNSFQKELGKRIEFVTMHQSFSYEDFVQGLKPKKGEKGIEFDYKNGVFKEICERAWNFAEISRHIYFPSYVLSRYEDLLVESKILPNNLKTQNDRLDYFANLINDSKSQILVKGPRDCFDRLLGDKSPREGWTKENYKNIEHWETCEETIRFFNLISSKQCIELIYKNWIQPVKEKIELHEKNLSKILREPYVIVLDEINRANISRVFGELIALIEKDKRDGRLTVTLPSGDSFTVPSNLYIIGTMNTADKSIALVDIALRRRFKFIPLYPDLVKLKLVLGENGMSDDDMELRIAMFENINRIIRSKKSVDFEIGHSYFMEKDTLINILNHQILPLMNEYFMYDLRKVKEIIEQSQKDREGNSIPKLGIELNDTLWNERGLLEVEKISRSTQEAIVDASVDFDTDENDN